MTHAANDRPSTTDDRLKKGVHLNQYGTVYPENVNSKKQTLAVRPKGNAI